MGGLFDDLVPQREGGQTPSPSVQAAGGLFDDLVPAGQGGVSGRSGQGLFDDLVPQKNAYLRTMDTLADASGKVTDAIRTGAQDVKDAAVAGWSNMGKAASNALGTAFVDPVDAAATAVGYPGLRQAYDKQFVAPHDQRIQAAQESMAENAKGADILGQIGHGVAQGAGQMTTLPADIYFGRALKAAMAAPEALAQAPKILEWGKGVLSTLPEATRALVANAPDFALGMAMKGLANEGPSGFAKGLAEGLAMHAAGGVGQSLGTAGRVATQAGAQGAVGAGMAATSAMEQGRAPTGQELAVGAGTGAAMGAPFGLMPGQMGVKRPEQRPGEPAPSPADSLHTVGDARDAQAQPQAGPSFLDVVSRAESGGDPNAKNPNSTARGAFQFVESTRNAILKESGFDAWSKDPGEQRKAAEYLAEKNRASLASFLGREPTNAEQYMAWFLGAEGGRGFLAAKAENPDAPATGTVRAGQVTANKEIFFDKETGRPRTLNEVFTLMGKKVGDEGQASAGTPRAPQDGQTPGQDVATRPEPAQTPESAFGDPLRPDLASLREDMAGRHREEVQPSSLDPWNIRSVQDAAGDVAGVPRDLARENELRNLRSDMQAREVQQRALEEQGAPMPAREAERLGQNLALPAGAEPPVDGGARSTLLPRVFPMGDGQARLALPEGQGFEMVGKPRGYTIKDGLADNEAWLRDMRRAANKGEGVDPIVDAVWGRIDKAKIDAATGKALRDKYGPGIFARKGKGAPLDILAEELNSTGVPVPEGHGGDPLASYLVDRGLSRRQAKENYKAQAQVEKARMDRDLLTSGMGGGDSMRRVQFRPEERNYELDEVPFSSQGDPYGPGMSRADVIRAVGRMQERAQGAAPMRIISSREIPVEKLDAMVRQAAARGERISHEDAARMIEGWRDPATGEVVLVHDNLAPGRAARVWMHEQVAHNGLRQVFGDMGRFGRFLDATADAFNLKGGNRRLEAEEKLARIAEKMKFDEALTPRERNLWQRLIDEVRFWLAKHGLRQLKPEEISEVLREALARTAHGNPEGRGRTEGLQEAGVFSAKEPGARFSSQQERSDFQRKHMADWREPSLMEKIKETDWGRAGATAQMIALDKSAPARRLAEIAGGKAQGESFDAQQRRRTGSHGIVRDMIDENGAGVSRYGEVGHETEVIPGSKTLGQIIAPLHGDAQAVRDFEAFMGASRMTALDDRNQTRTQRLGEISKELLDVTKDIRDETDYGRRSKLERLKRSLLEERHDLKNGIVSELDRPGAEGELSRLREKYGDETLTQWREMHKDLVRFADDAILKPRVDAGLLSREAYDRIMADSTHDFWTPFQREMDAEGGGGMGSAGPKRIKGSDRKIVSPIASILASVQRNVREVEQAKTNEALVSLRDVSPALAEVIKPMGKGGPSPGRFHAVTTWQDGVAHHWQVPWEVAIGLNGASPAAMRVFRLATSPFRLSAQALRLGATVLSPAFTFRNIVRDNFSAQTLNKHGYVAPRDFYRGLVEAVQDQRGEGSSLVSEWRRAGGETGVYTALERSAVELSMQDLLHIRGRTTTGQVVHWAGTPWRAIKLANEAGEKATRLGLYDNARRKGATPAEAMMESRDTTVDFSRSGLAGEFLNQVIPFWNANVQGVVKMVRSMGTGRFWLNVALGITAPSVMEWLAYHDDDEWRQLADWERDFFWHIKVPGGTWVRIPKPFELGAIYGSGVQRTLDQLSGQDPEGMKKGAKAIASSLTPPLSNPLVTPFVEGATNHSFFSGRSIDSKSMENLPPWMRFNNNTTEIAKLAGKLIDISPMKIDNWIRGQFGTAGMDTARSLDGVLTSGKAPAPERHWYENTPVVSAFVSREPVGSRSEAVNTFYDNLEKTTQEAAGGRTLRDAGNTDDMGRISQRDAFYGPAFQQVSKQFSDMRQEIAVIQQDQGMSPTEKRQRIDAIERRMTAQAHEINQAYQKDEPTPAIALAGWKSALDAQYAKAEEIAKEQGPQAARAFAQPLNLIARRDLVHEVGSVLSEVRKMREAADYEPNIPDGKRRWLVANASAKEQRAFAEFKSRSASWGRPY